MDRFVAGKAVKHMIRNGVSINSSKALILGIAFKENCPDIRNTKVAGIVHELEEFGLEIDVCDPLADKKEVQEELNITLLENPILDKYALIILAVPHTLFLEPKDFDFSSLSAPLLFDLKAVLPRRIHAIRL
jgi:UDP-N-acetyl-D-galactosamine dehydrogenase